MGVVGLLGKLMKGSNNESISFLCSINRKKPVKKVEEVTSKYLDTLENMIKIKTSEKLFKVDSQDDIRQYYGFYNAVDKGLKKLKKNCAAMEKIKKSDLEEMINNYNAPQIKWYEFEYIYAIIIVRTNTDNTILVDGIEEEDGKSYLNVKTGGWLDVTEDFRYPAMCVAVPNYRSLESSFLNVRTK